VPHGVAGRARRICAPRTSHRNRTRSANTGRVTEADAPPPSSFASLLEAEWAVIVAELVAIVGASTIRPTTFNEPGGGLVFIGFPDRCWGEDPPALVQRRHDLLVTGVPCRSSSLIRMRC
jgi:hypothetical protein